MRTVQSRAAPWMGAGLLGSIALVTAALAWLGAGQRDTVKALQLTARWAYAGGALSSLFGARFQPLTSAIYFGVGLLFAYTLALFSIPALAARLSPRARQWLFTLGLEYIALAFLRDFLHNPFGHGIARLAGYLPFVTLASSACCCG